MVQHPNPKKAVALIREAFANRQSAIQTKDAYNLLAQLWGYKDWATASALLSKDSAAEPALQPEVVSGFARADEDVSNWPVWVFCNQGGNEDEPMYVYPCGTRLENLYGSRRHWHLIDDGKTFAVQVPDDLITEDQPRELFRYFVGEEVACAYADSEEYGFPTCANEREVHQFLQEELGWSYLATKAGQPLVEVRAQCRGDDGATEWWVQARVHPAVHDKLLDITGPAQVDFEKACAELPLNELTTARATLWAPAQRIVCETLENWFDEVGSLTLVGLMSQLDGWHSDVPVANALMHQRLAQPALVLNEKCADATVQTLREALVLMRQRARQALAPYRVSA